MGRAARIWSWVNPFKRSNGIRPSRSSEVSLGSRANWVMAAKTVRPYSVRGSFMSELWALIRSRSSVRRATRCSSSLSWSERLTVRLSSP